MSPAQLALFRDQRALNNLRRDLSHAEQDKATAFFMFKRTGKDVFKQQYLSLVKSTDRLAAEIDEFIRSDD
jgi:hypothetical protein